MRGSRAVRRSKFLFESGQCEFDIIKELLEAGFSFRRHKRNWVVSKRYGNLVFERAHKCYYEAAVIAFRHHAAQTFVVVQGRVVKVSNMSTPLTKKIKSVLEDRKVPVFSLGGFRHSRPQPLRQPKPPDARVMEVLNDLVGPDLVSDYHRSTEEKDLTLMSAGYTVLTEKPPREFDMDLFVDLFILVALDMKDQQLQIPELSVVSQLEQVMPQSSCGLLPLNSIYGVCGGGKKAMQNSAVAVNLAAEVWGGVPGCLPYKPAGKDEVIKKGKKVRTIMVESQSNYMVLRHFFGGVVSDERRIPEGRGIGISSVGGSAKIPFMRWFHTWSKYHQGGWNEFCEFMESKILSESDKTAWEASTNEADGLAYLLGLLMGVDISGSDILLARALSDYVNPPVQIDGDLVYFSPWRVPSGSYLTAHGNTERHWLMARWVVEFFKEHGGAGTSGCGCGRCALVCDVEGFGDRFSSEELEYLSEYTVMGDDFIGWGKGHAVFNRLMDLTFGTETKNVAKPAFSQNFDEPEGVEFLRKHYHLDKTQRTFNIRVFREPKRLLAKLYHGGAKASVAGFRAAVLSAIWDNGANPTVYRVLVEMLSRVNAVPVDMTELVKHLRRYVRRNPALADAAPTYVPEYAMVLNVDASLLLPLEKVYWSEVRCVSRV